MKLTNTMTIFIRCTAALLVAAMCVLTGCMVGPKYHTPTAVTPPAYKELTPADYINTDGWKVAQPKDDALRGKWWEIFSDPELNELEEKVNVSNQTIAAAAETFYASRALVKEARAQLFPTLSASPSATLQRTPTITRTVTTGGSGTANSSSGMFATYSLPFDASWQPDLFGRIRNTIRSSAYAAQASAADLQNTRLTIQAEVAIDYFDLRGQDSLKQLLDTTIDAFQKSLDLTTAALYQTGIGDAEAVAQAETQLEATKAQDTALGIQRAQFEHAIAMLTGQPASTFSIPVKPLNPNPPAIPIGLPSQLLERRPDIAAAERLVAQANSQIGIARAAYFPTITLTGSAGLENTSASDLFNWQSRFFSIGAAGVETLFDAGLRHATVVQFQSQYNATVANYRQAVLVAFQQVEDNLATLRILSAEIQDQDKAVSSAQNALTLATDRYQLGIDPYLNVITAQTTLLSNQETSVNLRIQQMTASGVTDRSAARWRMELVPTSLARATG